jgi:hypothetical protein
MGAGSGPHCSTPSLRDRLLLATGHTEASHGTEEPLIVIRLIEIYEPPSCFVLGDDSSRSCSHRGTVNAKRPLRVFEARMDHDPSSYVQVAEAMGRKKSLQAPPNLRGLCKTLLKEVKSDCSAE